MKKIFINLKINYKISVSFFELIWNLISPSQTSLPNNIIKVNSAIPAIPNNPTLTRSHHNNRIIIKTAQTPIPSLTNCRTLGRHSPASFRAQKGRHQANKVPFELLVQLEEHKEVERVSDQKECARGQDYGGVERWVGPEEGHEGREGAHVVHRRDEANVEADLGVVEVGASEHDRVRVVDLLHIKSVCDSLGSMSITQPYIGSTHIDDKKNNWSS